MKRWVDYLLHKRPRRRRDDGRALIIWDFDGTLADSLAVAERLLVNMAPDYGITPPDKTQIAAWRSKEVSEIVQELGLGWWQVPGLLLRVQRGMKAEMQTIPAIAGLEAVLHELLPHYRFVMVTSNAHKNVKRWLHHQGWRKWFEFIVAGSSLLGKAAHFEKCIRKCAISKDRVIVVGDELRDVAAAQACGVAHVSVAWGFQDMAGFRNGGVSQVVQQPLELPEALRRALDKAG